LHYRIEERLGAGGMGEVYRAFDTRLGRDVALKFLPASYQYDPDRKARFFREARAASALRSPNIAAIYDIGEFDGSSFLVMEYVQGEVLSNRLRRGPLSTVDALTIGIQIADALDEAHRSGIVHRDIKSENLMMTDRGLVKVLDFGLAKVTAPQAHTEDGSDPTVPLGQETAVGLVMGTVSYMSPEQALGRTIDHRSDIFSIGVVLYEIVTTRLPFEGLSTTETIDRILHYEPVAISVLNPGIPHQFQHIVRKCLEKEADFRYQSARDLYIDLHNLKRDLQTAPRPGTTGHASSEHLPTAVLDPSRSLSSVPSGPSAGTPSTSHGGASSGALEKLDNAIAVITFSNITKEPSDDWIGSGIAETVTSDLKNVHGISVIGRERIFEALKSYASAELLDLDEKFAMDIGRKLGATWIVGGGYQRVGEMIRITARLVSVQTGALLKTVKIDGKISGIFDLQDKIVFEMSQGLNLELGHSEMSAIEKDETQSVEAYEDFSRAMINLRMASRDSLDRSIFLFEKAISHDPNYASAWAAMGAAYNLKGGFLGVQEMSEKAIEFLRKALELNPRLAEGHTWLGAAYLNVGRIEDAIESMKAALRLDPNNSNGHSSLARAYWIGKGMIPEAIAELDRAVALNPESGYAYLQLTLLQLIDENYEHAERAAKKAVELQEKEVSGTEGLQIVGAHARLGYVRYRQGRYDEAIEEYLREKEFLIGSEHALRDRTLIELEQKLGAAYLKKGMNDQAERCFGFALKMFEGRVARGADDPFTKYYIAALCALRGDSERAIKYLGETIEKVTEFNRIRARKDPDFASLRDDPRFLRMTGQAAA
ncbi:MAG: protein kinase domain-containing protein, partial [Blastocatellia bacterium]